MTKVEYYSPKTSTPPIEAIDYDFPSEIYPNRSERLDRENLNQRVRLFIEATMATSTTAPAPIASASEETAETQAAAAALVVDSVVEGVVTNTTTTTAAAASESTTPQQQQIPSSTAQPQTPSTTIAAASEAPTSAAQTYVNMQKSKRKERLEQNRISARESRKRKKSMIEELQRTVIALTSENNELNGRNRSLRTNLSDIGRKVSGDIEITRATAWFISDLAR